MTDSPPSERTTEPTGSIRDADPEDCPALLAIGTALDRQNPELLSVLGGGAGTVLVSEGPDGPAGYLAAVPCGEVVHVAEVAVAPDRRREGRATDLLVTLARRTDADRIRLAVAPDNGPALACYRSVGFSVVGRDDDYFEGEPALIVERSADPGGPDP
ncbi:N-acetyltransferase [Halobacteriales archaeon QS_8_69_26]|nr:MAG: N-acetyltransferase [Halobacteriales archaeon QS_8_69_26]